MVISRRHCEVNMDQGVLTVRDLGSRNGTFVNGERTDETILDPGDEIQIGPLKFIVQVDGVPQDKDLPPQTNQSSETATPSKVNTDLNSTEILGIPMEEPSDYDEDA
jgi:pSer/pThr/pTyr-binding forkhead associated (FHA) protein